MGNISQYNNAEPYRIKNLFNIVYKQGIIDSSSTDFNKESSDKTYNKVLELIDAGKHFKSTILTFTLGKFPILPVTIQNGIEQCAKGLVGLFQGQNSGKSIVQVATA
jgi:NADPH-dependent curcumin reductase CurA